MEDQRSLVVMMQHCQRFSFVNVSLGGFARPNVNLYLLILRLCPFRPNVSNVPPVMDTTVNQSAVGQSGMLLWGSKTKSREAKVMAMIVST